MILTVNSLINVVHLLKGINILYKSIAYNVIGIKHFNIQLVTFNTDS